MKPPPRFWWDFDGDDDDVVVQSDWKEGKPMNDRATLMAKRVNYTARCRDALMEKSVFDDPQEALDAVLKFMIGTVDGHEREWGVPVWNLIPPSHVAEIIGMRKRGEIAARSVEPLFVYLCVGKNPEENRHALH
jgi:hypothetical protein